MAISLVQTISNNSNFPNPGVAGTWGGNTTTGNTIIVMVGTNGSSNFVSSITDSQSNTYSKAGSDSTAGGAGEIEIWYAKNITGGTTPTLTVNMNTTNGTSFIAREYSGLDTTAPFDKFSGSGANSSAASSGATATTTQASELVVGAVFVSISSGSDTVSAGSGYGNLGHETSNGSFQSAMEDKTVSSTGAQTATFGLSLGWNWQCAVATFKAGAVSTLPIGKDVQSLQNTMGATIYQAVKRSNFY